MFGTEETYFFQIKHTFNWTPIAYSLISSPFLIQAHPHEFDI